MNGDIFYSQVDANLQREIRARAQAGASGEYRSTKYISYMLEKNANVSMIAYADNERTKILTDSTIGDHQQLSGPFLPSGRAGYLTDKKYQIIDATSGVQQISTDPWNPTFAQFPEETPIEDTSNRVPPFITSVDISIGDNSNGLINNATINITIPNPQRDLSLIESIYFRPGRHVDIKVQHADSAILTQTETGGILEPTSIQSITQLLDLYPDLEETKYNELRKMNVVTFSGLIVAFTFDYQSDFSVNATLSIKGASQVIPDLNLIIDSTKKPIKNSVDFQADPNSSIRAKLALSRNKTGLNVKLNPYDRKPNILNADIVPVTEVQNFNAEADRLKSFYEGLSTEVNNVTKLDEKSTTTKSTTTKSAKTKTDTNKKAGISKIIPYDETIQNECFVIWGTPFKGQATQVYITLAYLIDYINHVIVSKLTNSVNTPKIICTSNKNLCLSNSYPELQSADPMSIYLHTSKTYGQLTWLKDAIDADTQQLFNQCLFANPRSKNALIFINMEKIQAIIQALQSSSMLKVSELLTQISTLIYESTGHAIDMQLITPPEQNTIKDALLFYDAKYLGFQKEETSTPVIPFKIPMSVGRGGTVVRDFKFSGKLPDDASSLAYVLNQDPSEISESDIAPYVNYMYVANSTSRSDGTDGLLYKETRGNLKTTVELQEIVLKYEQTHLKYKNQLQQSIKEFGAEPNNLEKRVAMSDALQKYIQFPTETIQGSNQITAPIIPFDVEFTMDGINGFRYGDVLTFDLLPERYIKDTVFSIVSVTHTIDTAGMWTTTVRCIMRPKIDN